MMFGLRRQVSLYFPEPARSSVDKIRSQFNPEHAALIPAHVTVCREDELDDWQGVVRRIAELNVISITLEFGLPIREGNFVYLPATNSVSQFDSLRHYLLAHDGHVPRSHHPHATLIHPETGTCSLQTFREMTQMASPLKVHFTEVSLIEQMPGSRWHRTAAFR